MRYHAQALSALGVDVDLVGFDGTPLPRAVMNDSRITLHHLSARFQAWRSDRAMRRSPWSTRFARLSPVADAAASKAGSGPRPEPAAFRRHRDVRLALVDKGVLSSTGTTRVRCSAPARSGIRRAVCPVG
jgi:hypothetical protein